MKIKYGELEFYAKWLHENLELAGKQSRMRMKFINLLSDHLQNFEQYKQQLIKEHARTDDDGNPVVLNPDENGYGQADLIDPIAFQKDYLELAHEQIVIEENDTNKEMLLTLQACINDCPTTWKGDEATKYEAAAALFDDIYSVNE